VSLTIPAGVSLLGGFDCATFTVQSGYPKGALCADSVDDANLTVLDSTATPALKLEGGASSAVTVLQQLDVIAGKVGISVVDASPMIEKCRISIRPPSTQDETAAVVLSGGAAQVQQNCIRGGGGKAIVGTKQIGSAGIAVEAQSTATISNNIIRGGAGLGAANGYGSAGVYISSAAPTVTGNDIDGGTGSSSMDSRTGSVGVYAFSLGARAAGIGRGASPDGYVFPHGKWLRWPTPWRPLGPSAGAPPRLSPRRRERSMDR
jgi:hypothetical protein